MRIQARIAIAKIRVRNVVVFVSEIECSTAAGCEKLHATAKLGGEVESCLLEHAMVEIEEAATTREKRFNMAEVYEVDLCTDGTAADSIGIHSMTTSSARIAHQCGG